jgi:hypothetical protein
MRVWLAALVLVPAAALAQPNPAMPLRPEGGVIGPPAHIELVIVDAKPQDLVHPMYQRGATLQVKALITDAEGHVLGNSHPNCSPIFQAHGTLSGGQGAVTQNGPIGTVTFGNPGVFSVSVHCQQDPKISSESGTNTNNHAPYNFETSNSPFARDANGNGYYDKPVAERLQRMRDAMAKGAKPAEKPPETAQSPTPAPSSGGGGSKSKKGPGLLATVVVIVGTYWLVNKLLESDCSCMCNKTGIDCSDGGSATCEANCPNLLQGCGICHCESGCSPGFTARRGAVEELVAAGLERQRQEQRMAALANTRGETGSVARAAGPFVSALRSVQSSPMASTAIELAVVTYSAVIMLRRSPERASTDVVPWISGDGCGVNVVGRF